MIRKKIVNLINLIYLVNEAVNTLVDSTSCMSSNPCSGKNFFKNKSVCMLASFNMWLFKPEVS